MTGAVTASAQVLISGAGVVPGALPSSLESPRLKTLSGLCNAISAPWP